ncbi:MAG TPA: efflux RND transporter periplasmic adaptor subunit [Candidatus Eisenbacteria bacterium]
MTSGDIKVAGATGAILILALALATGWLATGCSGKRSEVASKTGAAEHAEHEKESDDHGGHDHGAEAGHDHGAETEPHAEGHDEHESEAVRLTPQQRDAAGITIETAGPASIGRPLELPGEIVLDADHLSHIVPRFPGVARTVHKGLGDRVRAGEVLAVLNSNESLSTYDVPSLIDGIVIEKHITLGEFVRDDQDIYVVADLSKVWVNMTVYPRDLARIHTGLPVSIRITGVEGERLGKIGYIGPVVGEGTRTALARVILPNPDGSLRPGLFVTGRVSLDATTVRIAVEDRALQTMDGRTVVFVESAPGEYLAQAVEAGVTDGEWTEVLSGITAGQRYVSGGSFILKSEKLKSEAGHEH